MSQTLGAILSELRKDRGLSQKDLADVLRKRGMDITNQGISKWENGMTQPNASQFLVLCDVLEVQDLLSTFLGTRTNGIMMDLNSEGRKKVEEYADLLRASGLYATAQNVTPIARVRTLPLYSIAVSAGTGQFLDSSDYELVEVGMDVPMNANFGVRIAGDSMEPDFKNGQVVWVHQQQTLQNGEIGVFLYDDNAYMKKLRERVGGIRLQSLNMNYPDIVVSDPSLFRVLGKVVG